MENRTKRLLAVALVLAIIIPVLAYAYLNTQNPQQQTVKRTYSWKQTLVSGFDNFGTATYKDGVLYAPSKAQNIVFALNASNGAVIWQRNVRQCDASPCVDGDRIYVCECFGFDSYENHVPTTNPRAMALNKATGLILWSFVEPSGYGWVGSPAVNGDYVYFTTYGAGVYALNRTDGSTLWHRQDIGQIVCSVAYHDGVVFVSAANSTSAQYALNATTGQTIWQVAYGVSWDTSPVVYNGLIIQVTRVLSTNSWSTYILDESTGHTIRKFEGRGAPSTPLVHDDKIFIPSNDRRLWAYSLTTGAELWHTTELHDGHPQEYSYSSPAISDGEIYYQSLSGVFYMINETTGTIGWSCQLDGYGYGSPSLGNEYAYITNDSGLYAFQVNTSTTDWPMFCQNPLHQSTPH